MPGRLKSDQFHIGLSSPRARCMVMRGSGLPSLDDERRALPIHLHTSCQFFPDSVHRVWPSSRCKIRRLRGGGQADLYNPRLNVRAVQNQMLRLLDQTHKQACLITAQCADSRTGGTPEEDRADMRGLPLHDDRFLETRSRSKLSSFVSFTRVNSVAERA